MMKKNFLLILAMGSWLCAAAQPTLSPRSASLLRPAAAAAELRMVSAYLTIDPSALSREALAATGTIVGLDLGTTLTARIPISALQEVASLEGLRYVQTASQALPMLDVARAETGADAVQAGTGLDHGYTGSGVVVGIVDSGFDYGHAAFTDSEGRLRISRVWEQATQAADGATAPEAFGYGVELTDPEAILAAAGDIYNNSHGTHVASIAAGSDSYLDGALRGMAPDAEIVLVSMLQAGAGNVNISDAIAYIFNYADEVGKPCVVNLSLGNNAGPHDGTSTFDVIADRLQGPGRLIVGAAGNAGTTACHLQRSFGADDNGVMRSFIDFYSSSTKGGDIEVWASPGSDIQVDLVLYKTSPLSESQRVTVYPSSDTEFSLGRNVSGTFTVHGEVSPLNDKPHVLLTSDVSAVRSGYAIALEVTSASEATVDAWADNIMLGFTDKGIEDFDTGRGTPTICEIGGTASRILTVGAYTTRSEYTRMGATTPSRLDETDGDVCSFSSFGPTADGRIKPQVCAPGCFISGAVNIHDGSGTLIYSGWHNDGNRDHYYGFMQGTSMASPMVTGVVATWLQAWPEMSPEDLLEVVKATSRTDSHTGALEQPSNHWGHGKIDAYEGLRQCLMHSGAGVGSVTSDSSTTPAIVRLLPDGTAEVTFTSPATEACITLRAIDGRSFSSTRLQGVDAAQTVTIPVPAGGVWLLTIDTPAASATTKLAR